MATFSDHYTRKQGMKRTYDYKVKIKPSRRAHAWEGTVKHAGELKGSPAGMVLRVPPDVAAAAARLMIEKAIEGLDGVAE